MKITHILETHIHADFLAGSRIGCFDRMYLSAEGGQLNMNSHVDIKAEMF
jgi:hydroxyacylglutathione hydrolase